MVPAGARTLATPPASERLEQAWQHLGRDRLAQVVHREPPLLLVATALDRYRSAFAAVLERIGDEVRHRPLHPIRIPPAISIALEAEADLPIGQSRSKLLDDPRAQLVPVHGRLRQLHSPHVRELDQVPDDPVHALRARYDAGRDLDTFHRERWFLPERERPHQ